MCRDQHKVPPIGRFTYFKRTPDSVPETNITLQDGCFGVAMLMRITALFRKTETPSVKAVQEIVGQQNGRTQTRRNTTGNESRVSKTSLLQEEKDSPDSDLTANDTANVRETSNLAASPDSMEDIADVAQQAQQESFDRANHSEAAVNSSSIASSSRGNHTHLHQGKSEDENPGQSPFADIQVFKSSPKIDNKERESHQEECKKYSVKESDQFSMEIIRCRAVCPDWRHRGANSMTTERPDTVVLGVPHLLLQLPAHNPARHPVRHAVQVGFIRSWVNVKHYTKTHVRKRKRIWKNLYSSPLFTKPAERFERTVVFMMKFNILSGKTLSIQARVVQIRVTSYGFFWVELSI